MFFAPFAQQHNGYTEHTFALAPRSQSSERAPPLCAHYTHFDIAPPPTPLLLCASLQKLACARTRLGPFLRVRAECVCVRDVLEINNLEPVFVCGRRSRSRRSMNTRARASARTRSTAHTASTDPIGQKNSFTQHIYCRCVYNINVYNISICINETFYTI